MVTVKALIRGEGETITQDMKIAGINWDTGAPLTNRDWCGGPYILMNDYAPEDPRAHAVAPEASQDLADDMHDTIVIDGVTYTRTS